MPAASKFHNALWTQILLTNKYPDILQWTDDGQVLIINDPPALLSLCRNLSIVNVATFGALARQLRNYRWRKLRGLELSIAIGRQHVPVGSELWKHEHLTAASTPDDVKCIGRRLTPRQSLKKQHGNVQCASGNDEIKEWYKKKRKRSRTIHNSPATPDAAVPSEPISTEPAPENQQSPPTPGEVPSLGYDHSPSFFATSSTSTSPKSLNVPAVSPKEEQKPEMPQSSILPDVQAVFYQAAHMNKLPILINDLSSDIRSDSVWTKPTLFNPSSYDNPQAELWPQTYQGSSLMEHAYDTNSEILSDLSMMPNRDPPLTARQQNQGSGKGINVGMTYSPTFTSAISSLYSSSASIAVPQGVTPGSRDVMQSLFRRTDLPIGVHDYNSQPMAAPTSLAHSTSSNCNFGPAWQMSEAFDFSDSGSAQGILWSFT